MTNELPDRTASKETRSSIHHPPVFTRLRFNIEQKGNAMMYILSWRLLGEKHTTRYLHEKVEVEPQAGRGDEGGGGGK